MSAHGATVECPLSGFRLKAEPDPLPTFHQSTLADLTLADMTLVETHRRLYAPVRLGTLARAALNHEQFQPLERDQQTVSLHDRPERELDHQGHDQQNCGR